MWKYQAVAALHTKSVSNSKVRYLNGGMTRLLQGAGHEFDSPPTQFFSPFTHGAVRTDSKCGR